MIFMVFSAGVGVCYTVYNQRLTSELTASMSPHSTMSLIKLSTMTAAAVVTNDSNWAGYIAASDLQTPQPVVTNVSASWEVPTVAVSPQTQDTFAAVWIGIGGLFDSTLIQVGTEQDSVNGISDYFAWFELLPNPSNIIDTIDLSPGDHVNVNIQLVDASTDEWSIYIQDVTTNQEFNYGFFYSSSQLSAEWIVERPEVGSRLATLANIGKVEFTNCQATIGAQKGAISSFPVFQSVMYESVQDTTGIGITQLTAVSDLINNGSSFTVDTNASIIPELAAWIILPLIMGITTLAAKVKKHNINGSC